MFWKHGGWLFNKFKIPRLIKYLIFGTSNLFTHSFVFKNIQWTDSQIGTQTSPTYILLLIGISGREEIFALGHSVNWS